ncbi:MAG: hypothetical protein H7069_02810 [Phormidesmis sp. FL-bin-119]|nr:hypothetical protein [Pedobacter sp.]
MKALLILVLGYLPIGSLHAQIHSITAMHNFMQTNADTTIVMSYSSNWLSTNNYMLVSKKGDTLTCYQYKAIDDIPTLRGVKVPSAIMHNVFYKRLYEPVDVHGEFHLLVLDEETLRLFWKQMQSLKLWTIKDDLVEGLHCPPVVNTDVTIDKRVVDDSTIHLDLITRNTIKVLSFYGPANYEEFCPSRPGRRAILNLEKLFLTHYK